VLGTPPALVLSQDQTLQLKNFRGDFSPFQLEKGPTNSLFPTIQFPKNRFEANR
jgi:hypothetical protein